MTMYNMVHGENSSALVALALIDHDRESIPRYRDAWVVELDGSYYVYVYTRMGGGNAGHWESWSDEPTQKGPGCPCPGCVMDYVVLPGAKSWADDEFDSTYRMVIFDVPNVPAHQEIAEMVVEPGGIDMGERWRTAFERMERGEFNEAELELQKRLGIILRQGDEN